MLKKVFVAITLGICLIGLNLSTGCSGGPGEPVKGKATNKDFAKGKGKAPDGTEAPDGAAFIE